MRTSQKENHRKDARPRHARRSPRGMTLTELLVVVLIIAALLAIAVPAFSSLLYSSEAAMAESQLRAAIRAGRDAALRSSAREDVALVFSYEPAPGGGRLVITPYVKVGEFYDLPSNLAQARLREIFVTTPAVESIQLPKHWMVRGYAPVNSIEPPPQGIWYEGNRYGQDRDRGDWVFPETHFYTSTGTAPGEGQFRQTFMIRFAGSTGALVTSTGVASLVLMPAQDDPPFPPTIGAAQVAELRALRLANPRRYVERIISSQTIIPGFKRELLGPQVRDMVAVKPVSAIALYDETRLAAGLRTRIDPVTGCLYKPHVTGQNPTFVPVTNASGGMTDDDAETSALINQWIEGNTSLDDGIQRREDGDEPEARIFTIDRYSGALKRVETQR